MAQLDMQRVEAFIASLGYSLWGHETAQAGRDRCLRLYIDTQTPKGVTADECAHISRQLRAWFRVEVPSLSDISLEISSPGVPRPLWKISQYPAYIGRSLSFKLHHLVNGSRKLTGKLLAVTEEQLTLSIHPPQEGEITFVLPFTNIAKAHVIEE